MNDIALPADAGRAMSFSGNEQDTESDQETDQLPLIRKAMTAMCWVRRSAQPEMNRQNGLAGHGDTTGPRRAEAGTADRFPGSLIHAVPGSLQHLDGSDLARRIKEELQHDGPFLAKATRLARVLGHDHALDARPAWRTKIHHPVAAAPASAGTRTGSAPTRPGSRASRRHKTIARPG